MAEGIGESEMKELVPEWGWRRDQGSWFQRQGEAYRKQRSVIFRENDEGGRARVTTTVAFVHVVVYVATLLTHNRNITRADNGLLTRS